MTASRLMGADVIITGVSSDIAQTPVTIGVDLSKMHTVGDLQGGIEEAERQLGYRVSKVPDDEHLRHSDSVGLLDVVRVHNELFIEVLAGVRDIDEAREVARASTALLIDLLASFVMSQRGFMISRLAGRPGHESAPGTSG